MSFKTDLHIHSWYSDGTMSPEEIVEKYVQDKYDMIALTDHEVIAGIKEAEEAGKEKNLRVIPGIEIATLYKGIELHILGYYFNMEDEPMLKMLDELAEERKLRNIRLLKVLNDMGCDLAFSDLLQRPDQKYIGKPNFARAMVKKGYISSVKDAFEPGKYLESEAAKKAERVKPDSVQIIELINNAGGMAVLAHPAKIKGIGKRGTPEFMKGLDDLLRELKKNGLKGLECIYPGYSDEERLSFIDKAAKYHLHITEGSDFHGE